LPQSGGVLTRLCGSRTARRNRFLAPPTLYGLRPRPPKRIASSGDPLNIPGERDVTPTGVSPTLGHSSRRGREERLRQDPDRHRGTPRPRPYRIFRAWRLHNASPAGRLSDGDLDRLSSSASRHSAARHRSSLRATRRSATRRRRICPHVSHSRRPRKLPGTDTQVLPCLRCAEGNALKRSPISVLAVAHLRACRRG
jgi:hypothetical protein